jgi:hypothetical protein
MSTSETVELPAGPCPCGAGHIMKSVTTQDNPWSGADIHYYVGCPKCSSKWMIEHEQLVDRATSLVYKNHKRESDKYWSQLRDLITPLVDKYFDAFAASTKKAELAEMQRLGIASMAYPAFLKEKKEGRTPSQMSYALRNMKWVRELVQGSEVEIQFNCLYDSYKAANDLASAASHKVVRRRMLPQSI